MSREADYQHDLIETLYELLPGSIVLKNDSSYVQGIPDLTVLWHTHWAWLEVKISASAPIQPNQTFYIDAANEMSFGSFIWPDIEEEVLDALQSAFGISRPPRFPESEQLSLVELR